MCSVVLVGNLSGHTEVVIVVKSSLCYIYESMYSPINNGYRVSQREQRFLAWILGWTYETEPNPLITVSVYYVWIYCETLYNDYHCTLVPKYTLSHINYKYSCMLGQIYSRTPCVFRAKTRLLRYQTYCTFIWIFLIPELIVSSRLWSLDRFFVSFLAITLRYLGVCTRHSLWCVST